jgi:hypothetical protein
MEWVVTLLMMEAPEVLALLLSPEDAVTPADRSEWLTCSSPTRYYVALNETLGEEELIHLVLDWFLVSDAYSQVATLEAILAEDLPWIYRAWREVMISMEDQGMCWIEHVRLECEPVEGFQWIGRDANESRRYRPSDILPYPFLGGEL